MENKLKMQLQRYKRFLILGGVAVLSLLLATQFMLWSAQAAHQATAQETIKLEFSYSGDDSSSVFAAVDDFADLLSQETGLTIQASLHTCEADVVEHLGAGQADVAPLSSVAYIHGHDAYGIQARLVNSLFGQTYYRSQINVQTASGYTDIWDLQDTRFAASNSNSTSGYLVPYLMILDATGMTPSEFFSEVNFVGTHHQVIRDVYTGAADCGAAYEDARQGVVGEYPDVYDVVTVLAVSEEIPNTPWAFRSGLNEMMIQQLVDGIIAVASTPEGDQTLDTIFGSNLTGIGTTHDSAYDIVRDLISEFGFEMAPCNHNYLPTVINSSGD